jgi:hypothetical protein
MPTTNANLAKKAIIAALKAAAGPAGLLDGVSVDYAYNGNVGALSVYGGGWRILEQIDAVAEGPGVLVAELVSVSLYVRALARPAVDVEETDDQADAVLTAIGTVFKAAPKLAGPLTVVGVASGQGDYSRTDEETISIQALQVQVRSNLSWGP